MTSIKPILKIVTITTAVLFIVGYSGYEARNIIRGPIVEIVAPTDGSTVTEPLIEVRGTAKNISIIRLNDRNITVDEHGVFREKMLLSPGYNIIKLSASDKFGRTKETKLEIVLASPRPLVSLPSQNIN